MFVFPADHVADFYFVVFYEKAFLFVEGFFGGGGEESVEEGVVRFGAYCGG